MRWLTHLFIVILLISGLYIWISPTIRDLWLQSRLSKQNSEQARASNYFPFIKNQWLTFDIVNQSRLFRFYFHGSLKDVDDKNTRGFKMNYQWLDDDGGILKDQHYYINTRKSPFLPGIKTDDLNPGELPVPLATRFYNHNRTQPSLDQALYLSPSVQPNATKLRFRVSSMDAGITQIGVRPYMQYQRELKDVKVIWKRMSRGQRETLSKASVYPSFLLSTFERDNLLSKYWKPIGPIGVLDEDYLIETLYLRENIAPTLPEEIIVPDGLYASSDHWVTILLGMDNQNQKSLNRYRIQWQAIGKQATPELMKLRWQGIDYKMQQQWKGEVNEQIWEGKLASGLLQVIPNRSAILKLYQMVNGQWLDITPEKRRTRAYVCSVNSPLFYSLAPGKDRQSLKISGRRFYRNEQTSNSRLGNLNIRILGKNGHVITRDRIQLTKKSYPYHQFSDAPLTEGYVYEPQSRYIDAHKNSSRLKINCTTPTLITVSSRPWRHPVHRNLPLDHNPWHSYMSREPTWFIMQPENLDHLITQKQYHSLLWYLKPIESNKLIASGDFTWNALPSQDVNALEKQLFSRVNNKKINNMKIRGSSYQNIQGVHTLRFADKSNQTKIRPQVVYLRNSIKPISIEVLLDSKSIINTMVAGKSGKFRLPSIAAGSHQLEFRSKSKDIQWFVNNTEQSKRSHLLRTAYPLLQGAPLNNQPFKHHTHSLNLPITITDNPQQLSFWLFSPSTKKRLNCQIILKAKRHRSSQSSHSFRHYNYKITSHEYPESMVLQQKNGHVRGPIPILIHLDKDLPAQMASASLSCDQEGVLASAGIISEGLTPYYDFREHADAH